MPASTPQFKRLLIRGTNWLGDAVMTTPALIRLRERFPSAEFAILTPEKLADLYTGHPAVKETISVPPGEPLLATAGRIRRGGFDAALVLPNSHRAALEVFLGRIPVRAGIAAPLRSFLLTHVACQRPGKVAMRKLSGAEIRRRIAGNRAPATPPGTEAHQVRDYLHLVSEVFGCGPEPAAPVLRVTEEEQQRASRRFGLHPDRPLLALSPGAQYGPAKRWPAEYFIKTALAAQKERSAYCVILGAKADLPACQEVAGALNQNSPGSALNLAGQTSLRELMTVIRLSDALLTNDSGPMHLAVALGTPVIALFGSTSPELTGPFPPGAPHTVLRSVAPCSPCFRRECPIDLRCLRNISPETATHAVLDALNRPRI
jgi:heptosyltransferase-2